ncbi:MAG: DUF262 domain-containing protein [Deltaproteobacteria bacterium]|nr:DUF262 domain-containing protein [Deltaproteobacteria bacterium]
MAIEQLTIEEIVKRAVNKSLDIPEFQREFVWGTDQVKSLVDSLYKDYPVGSFLLWDSSEYQESKTAQGSQASLWIVDGQQRTTALSLILGHKPYWWDDNEKWNRSLEAYDVMVNLLPDGGDAGLDFALPNPIRRHDPRWVSVREVVKLEKVESLSSVAREQAEKIFKFQNPESTLSPEEKDRLFDLIHPRISRLWKIRERDIPVIKISHEVEDVAEIFARLNQAGTRVKEADVTLALAAVRNPGWVRNEYLPFCKALEEHGWDLDAGIFIRTMTGIGHGRARLVEVPKEFWSPTTLPIVWRKAKEVIEEVRKRCAEFGIFSPALLPSTNSLIPFFALNYKARYWSDYNFKKALSWFLLANRDGRYSGSAITSLNEDVRAIKEAETFDEAMENLLNRLQVDSTIADGEFLNRYERAGNRFLRLMVYLVMFNRQARDWVDNTRIGYDKTGAPVATGFEPQWHHIYPRSILRDRYQDDEINALANITVLNERTNVKKLSAKEPIRYLQEFNITPELLTPHAVSEKYLEARRQGGAEFEAQWSLDSFQDFIQERNQTLAREANEFLQRIAAG